VAAATAAWRAAYDSRDPARIIAMYDSDAVLLGTTAKTVAPSPAAITEYFTFSDVRDGQAVSVPARFTLVFRNRDGKWLIVGHHSSRVP
jgi:hypothetical protein